MVARDVNRKRARLQSYKKVKHRRAIYGVIFGLKQHIIHKFYQVVGLFHDPSMIIIGNNSLTLHGE